MSLYGKDCVPGRKFRTAGRTITEADIMLFAGLTGDNTALHTDAVYAAQTRFKGFIAQGLLVSSVAVGLFCRAVPIEYSVMAGAESHWVFMRPVHAGDTVRCEAEVVQARRSASKPDRGPVTFSLRVCNQHGELCQEGKVVSIMWWEEEHSQD